MVIYQVRFKIDIWLYNLELSDYVCLNSSGHSRGGVAGASASPCLGSWSLQMVDDKLVAIASAKFCGVSTLWN